MKYKIFTLASVVAVTLSSFSVAQNAVNSTTTNQRTLQMSNLSVLDGLQMVRNSYGKEVYATQAAADSLYSSDVRVSVTSSNESAGAVCRRLVKETGLMVSEREKHLLLFQRADAGKPVDRYFSVGQLVFDRLLNSNISYLDSVPLDAYWLIQQVRLQTGLDIRLDTHCNPLLQRPTCFDWPRSPSLGDVFTTSSSIDMAWDKEWNRIQDETQAMSSLNGLSPFPSWSSTLGNPGISQVTLDPGLTVKQVVSEVARQLNKELVMNNYRIELKDSPGVDLSTH